VRLVGFIALVAFGACAFEPRASNEARDAAVTDAASDQSDAATDGATSDATPAACSTTGLVCPNGNARSIPASCSASATECWVGCRDGDTQSPTEAAQHCANWGGRLGTFASSQQEGCVRTVINGAIMLGLAQAGGESTPLTGWSWNGDGNAPPYLPWGAGQPNDADGVESDAEQCAFSNTSSQWHDMPCGVTNSARWTCVRP
jgi:hypothetical protein